MKTINKIAYDLIVGSRYSDYKSLLNTANKYTSSPYKVLDVKDEILRIKCLREKRFINNSVISVRDSIWRPYQGLLNNIARSLPNMGYEMGQYNRVYLRKTDFVGRWDNANEYSCSSKYKATHGECVLNISVKELKQTTIIAGLVTVVGEKIQKNFFKCKWVTSTGKKQFFRLNMIDGYLFEGYHFTASGLKEAKGFVRAYKDKASIVKGDVKLKNISQKFNLNEIFVEYQDSLNAGNCESGTRNFANINSIDLSTTGAVRADYLVRILEETDLGRQVGKFVYKAIDSAKLRYAQMMLSKKIIKSY
jgi:hypothetical protein